MKITLSELCEIYRKLPPPRRAGEYRKVLLRQEPEARILPHVLPPEEPRNEIMLKSVASYVPGELHSFHRWVVETPLRIILDRW